VVFPLRWSCSLPVVDPAVRNAHAGQSRGQTDLEIDVVAESLVTEGDPDSIAGFVPQQDCRGTSVLRPRQNPPMVCRT
jgi:hypothetical protein